MNKFCDHWRLFVIPGDDTPTSGSDDTVLENTNALTRQQQRAGHL